MISLKLQILCLYILQTRLMAFVTFLLLIFDENIYFMFQAVDGKVMYVYKKVAMVEQFFDIIYSVHVEAAGENQLRGRAGKHCGQKRTYRAVCIC